MEYELTIKEIIEKKLSDGSFEETFNKYVDKAIDGILQDLFKHSTWNSNEDGKCYAIIKDAISPILVSALNKCELNEMAQKTLLVLNQLILESSLHQFSKNVSGALELFKNNEFKFDGKISLLDMLDKYKKEVESYSGFDKDWLNEHEFDICDGTADLEISVEVRDNDEYRYSSLYNHKILIFKVNDLDEEETEFQDTLYSVPIVKTYNGKWVIDGASLRLSLADLRFSQNFVVYCSLIAMNYMEITDLKDAYSSAKLTDLY